MAARHRRSSTAPLRLPHTGLDAEEHALLETLLQQWESERPAANLLEGWQRELVVRCVVAFLRAVRDARWQEASDIFHILLQQQTARPRGAGARRPATPATPTSDAPADPALAPATLLSRFLAATEAGHADEAAACLETYVAQYGPLPIPPDRLPDGVADETPPTEDSPLAPADPGGPP